MSEPLDCLFRFVKEVTDCQTGNFCVLLNHSDKTREKNQLLSHTLLILNMLLRPAGKFDHIRTHRNLWQSE